MKTREKARARLLPFIEQGYSDRDRLQRSDGRRPADNTRPRRLGFFGFDSGFGPDAEELWIWTDVDGIMTADPRLVPNAAVLEEVTYKEAAELAYNGAKVLHPRTLAPLIEKGIPVWSKNSFKSAPGTRIVPRTKEVPRTQSCHIDGERCARLGRCRESGRERDRHHGRALDALAGVGSRSWRSQARATARTFVF